ncbi:MAG: nucleotidyltransferase domain-containing protein [Chlorobiaceae bacterium]|nr:nucleotidyltransferase domain-containing protein [Chlorobiaceae bacterium]
MKFGLEEPTISQINAVISRYRQVERVVLYGSRAKGNYKAGSDIDLTLIGGDDLDLKVLYHIMDDIDDLLLPYSFDISLFRSITDPDVLDHIDRVGKVLYEKTSESNVA